MIKYNTLNVKLSNLQLHKLKEGTKNRTEVTLNLSSNIIGDSNNETNFPHKCLLTNTQVSRICKGFANGSSANVKFSETQLYKMVQLGGCIYDLLDFAVHPSKIMFHDFNKVGDLPKNVPDINFIKTANQANILRKIPKDKIRTISKN